MNTPLEPRKWFTWDDLGRTWDILGTYLGHTWDMLGTCLGDTWDMIGRYLGHGWGMVGTRMGGVFIKVVRNKLLHRIFAVANRETPYVETYGHKLSDC